MFEEGKIKRDDDEGNKGYEDSNGFFISPTLIFYVVVAVIIFLAIKYDIVPPMTEDPPQDTISRFGQ